LKVTYIELLIYLSALK